MPDANDFRQAAAQAAVATNQALHDEQQELQLPTWGQVRCLLPEPGDQEALDEMIAIVSQSTDHNQRVAALVKNIDRVAGVVIKILERVP